MKIVLLFFIAFALPLWSYAQRDALPKIDVTCPAIANIDQPVEFRVTTQPAWSPRVLSVIAYSWVVSFGEIDSGQGSDTIHLLAREAGKVTATVRIDNVWFEPIEQSCTTAIYSPPKARLISDFRAYNIEYVQMMLESYLSELRNDPTATGQIVVQGRNALDAARLERIVRNRMKVVRFDPGRVNIVRGNNTSLGRLEYWLIPPGAQPPK
jgi:hypothetical protein